MRTIIRDNYTPEPGDYHERIVIDRTKGKQWIFDCDGVFTDITGSDIEIANEFGDKTGAAISQKFFTDTVDTLNSDINSVLGNLDAEIAAREEADTALAGDILAERTARTNADTALQAAVSAEQTARQTADANLQDQIDNIEEVIPAQASASNQLADKNFVNSSVATNTANYISNNGQPFNSLAELEAYSGPLTNNDYAFVTGTDAQGNTFYDRYKYNANTGEWAFEYELNNSSFTANQWATINSGITSGDVTKLQGLANIQTIGANLTLANGELSATDTTYTAGNGLALNGTQFSVDTTAIATQSDLTAGLATKQDTLTAGANISIDSNNVISATDTTYSDFVGTDGTVAGSTGLVPAPATTDAGKFLKADGTWDEAGSPINVVQTTGTSTTDVMSQNATASMVFADPSTRRKVRLGDGSSANGTDGIAIGYGANANSASNSSVAIGSLASVEGAPGGVALGAGSKVAHQYSVTFCGGETTANGVFNIGLNKRGWTGIGYNSSDYRLLTGLYDPQSAHDAATKGYVDTAIAGAGVKELTSADYNFPTSSPSCVALWLLDPGQYTWGSNVTVCFNDFGATTLNAGGAIVIKNVTNTGIATIIAQSSYGKRNIYETNVSNGYPTGTSTMQFGGPEDILKVKNVYNVSGSTIRGIKLGNDNSLGTNSISIGTGANGSYNANYSTIIGANAATAWNGNVALGAYSGTNAIFDAVGEVAINSTNTSYGYNNSNYRLLRGLYDPQADHDAANKQYVDTAVASAGAAEINSTDWSALWQ